LSSLGENTEAYHREIATYMEQHPDNKNGFSARDISNEFRCGNIKGIYGRTEYFFANNEEAEKILGSHLAQI